MKKILLIALSSLFLLMGCQENPRNDITLDEILSSFKEQKLELQNNQVNRDSLFGMKLNGLKPKSYTLNVKPLFIYIYDSVDERKKGFEDFRDKTASSNIVSFKLYEVENVLLFYVHGQDLSTELEVDADIQVALDRFK